MRTVGEAYMTKKELAKRMSMSEEEMARELQTDAYRPQLEKKYPFAQPKKSKSGSWLYRIHRKRFEAWENGRMDQEILAYNISQQVVERLKGGIT